MTVKESTKALLINTGLLFVAFVLGCISVVGMKYIYHDPEPLAYETVYSMIVAPVQDVENKGPTRREMQEVERKCKADYDMAFYIQQTRIRTGDTWEAFRDYVKNGYHPGDVLGNATTPEEIAIKDRFWKRTLLAAEYIYKAWDRGIAPDKVANVFAEACVAVEQLKLDEKYGLAEPDTQEYNI